MTRSVTKAGIIAIDPSNVAFQILLLMHVVVIWLFPYFPSQDGPVHLHLSFVLNHYHDPAAAVFREFYEINPKADPNWLVYGLLSGLMRFFPAGTAEKIFLTIYAVSLPVAFRYLLESLRKGSGFFSAAIFPFVFNLFLLMGFYNFSLSFPIYFLTLGFWIRNAHRLSVMFVLMLTGLSFALYFSHPVSLLAAFSSLAVLALYETRDYQRKDRRAENPESLPGVPVFKKIAVLAGSFLPALVFLVLFFAGKGWLITERPPASILLSKLLSLFPILSLGQNEIDLARILAYTIVAGIVLVFMRRLKSDKRDPADSFGWASLLFFVLSLVSPQGAAEGKFCNERWMIFFYFTGLVWIGTQTFSTRMKKVIPALAIGVTGVLFLIRAPRWIELNSLFYEVQSAGRQIRDNSTVLPLSLVQHGKRRDGSVLSWIPAPFVHTACIIAAERNIVPFDNFAAALDYFPIRYRAEKNPYSHLGEWMGVEQEPPVVDIEGYGRRTGRKIDFVLLSGLDTENQNLPKVQNLYAQLEKDFRLLYVSQPAGFARLYERNQPGPVHAGEVK